MAKRYDDPIDVTSDDAEDGAPRGFRWRGRLYEVDQRLGTWRAAGEWWDGATARDREYHRILARPSGDLATGELDPDGFMSSPGAVYDVYLDRRRGTWRLERIWD